MKVVGQQILRAKCRWLRYILGLESFCCTEFFGSNFDVGSTLNVDKRERLAGPNVE